MRVVVEFLAGRLNLVNKKLLPDSTKGLFKLIEVNPGHFTLEWTNRETGQVQYVGTFRDPSFDTPSHSTRKSQNVQVGQAEFVPVPKGTGRVYYFKFNDRSIPKAFFWMQDASSDKDHERYETINRILSTPPAAPSAPVSEPQNTGRVQLSDLQRIISNLGNGDGGNGGHEYADEGRGMRVPRGPSLQAVLSSSRLEAFIINLSSQDEARLAEYLPDECRTKQDMIELIHSAQFQQAVASLDRVLHSEDLPSIFYQLGLTWSDDILHRPVVESFFRAIQKKVQDEKK